MSECRNFGKAESLCQLAELSCTIPHPSGRAVSSNSMLSCQQQRDETEWRTLIRGLDVLRTIQDESSNPRKSKEAVHFHVGSMLGIFDIGTVHNI